LRLNKDIEEVNVNPVKLNTYKEVKELGKSIKKKNRIEKKSIYFKKKGREDVECVVK
jgi:hypothetical protein